MSQPDQHTMSYTHALVGLMAVSISSVRSDITNSAKLLIIIDARRSGAMRYFEGYFAEVSHNQYRTQNIAQ